MICERMTPELPFAPISAPRAASFAASATEAAPWMPSMAAFMVRDMLVPVSPSGTGKTLIALRASACSRSAAAPSANARASEGPSIRERSPASGPPGSEGGSDIRERLPQIRGTC